MVAPGGGMTKRVLVACEYSGVVRDAFLAAGFDAMSCDLLDTDVPGPHHRGDVRGILGDGWDLLIAHPPCTRLCNSGVRWLHERNLWDDMRESAEFFRSFLDAPVPLIAVENPVMHKYAREIVGRGQDCCVQPWEHGHPESKRTCFWLKGLPPLIPTDVVSGREQRIWKLPPSEDRWKIRSQTYPGIAKAMVEQWGPLV